MCGFFTGGVSVVVVAEEAFSISLFFCFLLFPFAFGLLVAVGDVAFVTAAAVVGVVGAVGDVVVLEPGVVAGVVAWKLLLGVVEIGT